MSAPDIYSRSDPDFGGFRPRRQQSSSWPESDGISSTSSYAARSGMSPLAAAIDQRAPDESQLASGSSHRTTRHVAARSVEIDRRGRGVRYVKLVERRTDDGLIRWL